MDTIKRLLLAISLMLIVDFADAQTANDIYNKYLDFNLARLQGETDKAISLGEDLLPNTDKLKPNTRNSFYYSIGNLYENDGQSVKAINYYEKVVAAVPDYYVAQRGLGYLYMKQVEYIASQLNAAKSDVNENKRLAALYAAAVKKALPHLEKAQACDPDKDTLALIKTLYNNIKDKQGASTLDARLKVLGKSCIDLLDDK